MIEPLEKSIPLPNGTERIFILSKFDAISGREIVSQYPTTGAPKIGDYKTNEEIMLKLMAFVGVSTAGDAPPLRLTTRALVTNHVPDWETLARLEWAMMEYNCSFFAQGKASSFFEDLAAKLPLLISSILTPLLEQLSQSVTPPSES